VWSPQQYISEGKQQGVSDTILTNAVAQIELVAAGQYQLPGIVSLRHLARRTLVPYSFLRGVIDRGEHRAYRKFAITKRSGGKRFIHVPTPDLKRVQKWITEYILKKIPVHSSSFAFSPGSSIYRCANRHCGAQWLIKMDITGFFESISEIQVYRVFAGLGYQPLVAFELARLVTVPVGSLSPRAFDPVWKATTTYTAIPSYKTAILGYLPQGAPTSPMMSNLIMREIDEVISKLAAKSGFTYTRYSDDLTFSKRDKSYSRNDARLFIAEVGKILVWSGFRPQHRKTIVVPPGSRKIVLGLQVDGDVPRLTHEFKDRLRQHLHYLERFGPVEHAMARKFETVWGMKAHIRGLIDFANMVESIYAGALLKRFELIDWPV
jgi:RNA-directed DNA polymerase